MPKIYWKIVEINPKTKIVKTLFHGVRGNRELPKNKWLRAQLRMVTDGTGTAYLSGFHILPSKEVALEYIKRFTTRVDSLAIVPCKAKQLRRKIQSNHEVYLAEYIKLV